MQNGVGFKEHGLDRHQSTECVETMFQRFGNYISSVATWRGWKIRIFVRLEDEKKAPHYMPRRGGKP
jgi:hypothetical protein